MGLPRRLAVRLGAQALLVSVFSDPLVGVTPCQDQDWCIGADGWRVSGCGWDGGRQYPHNLQPLSLALGGCQDATGL